MKSSRSGWVGAVINRRSARRTLAFAAVWVTALAMVSIPAARAAARTGTEDRDISSAIETDFLISDQVPSHSIDVRTKDGIVTLSGSVYNILARDKATEIAEGVKGVRSVVNEISVKPVSRSDEEIRRDIRDALFTDPATDSEKIDVEVRDGMVTLSGKVASYGEKDLCTEVAKRVRGVRGVEDEIHIEYKKSRPNKEIAAEIEGLLRDDVRIDAQRIALQVRDGKVELSGTVRSAAEKSLARSKAWVAGVQSVEAGDLKVEWFAPDTMQRESRYVTRTDPEIEKAVHEALRQDPRVWSFDVQTDSDYGVVTLRGTVEDLKARKAAEQDAKNTTGVWRVKNHLKVRPVTHLNDEEIVSSVSAALQRDPYLDRYDIDVSVYNGEVYLYGMVDSEFEKLEAEDVAFRVKGVLDVADYLSIRKAQPWKSDVEIKYGVEDHLFWDPSLNSNNVDVSVQNGVATLTGTVDGWYQYSQAAEDAFQGGAREVKNELHMEHAPQM